MSAGEIGPGSARNGSRVPPVRVLEVAVLWGGTILEAQHVASGGVGLDRAGRLRRDGGSPIARLEEEGGVVEVAGPIRVERAGGGVEDVEGRAVLAEGDLARVGLGRLQLVARVLPPVPAVRRGVLGQVDLYFTRMLVLTAMGAATLLVALQLTPLRLTRLADELGRRLPAVRTMVPVTPPRPQVQGPAIAEGRFSPVATPPRPRPGGKRSFHEAGLLGGMDGGTMANILGGGLDGAVDAALGQLRGGSTMGGLVGLGPRGGGAGGGGCCGGLDIGGVGTRRGGSGDGLDLGSGGKAAGPRIIRGATRVEGGLSKDAVGDVIRSHANQVRYCYERSLQSDPSLAGKVRLSFVIDGTGHVSEALVAEDTLATGAVAECVRSTVLRWVFPEPRGGGQVLVTYPWIFEAAGD